MSYVSQDPSRFSAEELADNAKKVQFYVMQVLDGAMKLEDVPSYYLDDVISTGFYEASGHEMTIDRYIRFFLFRLYLHCRHSPDSVIFDEVPSPF